MAEYIKKSYAKINHSLKVVGRYNDVLHKIESDIYLINLFSTLTIRINESEKSSLTVSCKDYTINPHTLEKTLLLWSEKRGCALNVNVDINNPIPLQTGLGGMSSYASTLINTLEEYCYCKHKIKKLNKKDKMALGFKIGCDVPLFLSGYKACHVSGAGEIVKKINNTKQTILLHFPNFKTSTQSAYSELDKQKKSSFIDLNSNKEYYNKLCKLTKTELWKLSGSGSCFFIEDVNKETQDYILNTNLNIGQFVLCQTL